MTDHTKRAEAEHEPKTEDFQYNGKFWDDLTDAEKEAEWQKMCQSFVMAGPLEDEPHEPRLFKEYVNNLNSQLIALREAVGKAREEMRRLPELYHSAGVNILDEHLKGLL